MIAYMVKTVSSLFLLAILLCYGSCVLASGSSAISFPGEQRGAFLREVLDPSSAASAGNQKKSASLCRPRGQIHDACADYESVEMLNDAFMYQKLDELRKTKYFRYFLVDLYKDCPFWVDDGLCMNRACAVEKLNDTDVPEEFRALRLSEVRQSQEDTEEGYAQSSNDADFCHLDDEDASPDAIYVDLLQNPERFTGYAGASANRVWRSIYEENCFGGIKFTEPPRSASSGGTGFISMKHLKSGKALPITMLTPNDAKSPHEGGLNNLIDSMQAPMDAGNMEQCLEKRVFYRVISGLHASISIHICNEYLDAETKTWKPNLQCFMTRISQHPERLQNVYFDYVLMMRALSKAGEYLDKFALREGDEIRDPQTRSQLRELLKFAGANRPSFDEHQLFATNNDPAHNMQIAELKEDFRAQFRNISRIMDCVGCDKCRLWGKLQISGIGTALKLLFAFEEDKPEQHVSLRRTELVALINTAYRLSESIQAVEEFRELYRASLYGESKLDEIPTASGHKKRSSSLYSLAKQLWQRSQPTLHALYSALHTITTDTLNTLAVFVDQGDALVPEDQMDDEL